MQPTTLPPSRIAEILQHYHANCPALEAVVVAAYDGTLLGHWGQLPAPLTARAAARLGVTLPPAMALVRPSPLTESLIWAPPAVWYWAQLEQRQVLLACCMSTEHAGALRLAGQLAVQQLLAAQLPSAPQTTQEDAAP